MEELQQGFSDSTPKAGMVTDLKNRQKVWIIVHYN